jgi:hypothetical protein
MFLVRYELYSEILCRQITVLKSLCTLTSCYRHLNKVFFLLFFVSKRFFIWFPNCKLLLQASHAASRNLKHRINRHFSQRHWNYFWGIWNGNYFRKSTFLGPCVKLPIVLNSLLSDSPYQKDERAKHGNCFNKRTLFLTPRKIYSISLWGVLMLSVLGYRTWR